jgi:hypothetical protein
LNCSRDDRCCKERETHWDDGLALGRVKVKLIIIVKGGGRLLNAAQLASVCYIHITELTASPHSMLCARLTGSVVGVPCSPSSSSAAAVAAAGCLARFCLPCASDLDFCHEPHVCNLKLANISHLSEDSIRTEKRFKDTHKPPLQSHNGTLWPVADSKWGDSSKRSTTHQVLIPYSNDAGFRGQRSPHSLDTVHPNVASE